jgi:hypothetical protein
MTPLLSALTSFAASLLVEPRPGPEALQRTTMVRASLLSRYWGWLGEKEVDEVHAILKGLTDWTRASKDLDVMCFRLNALHEAWRQAIRLTGPVCSGAILQDKHGGYSHFGGFLPFARRAPEPLALPYWSSPRVSGIPFLYGDEIGAWATEEKEVLWPNQHIYKAFTASWDARSIPFRAIVLVDPFIEDAFFQILELPPDVMKIGASLRDYR